jgi:hypothetical protein
MFERAECVVERYVGIQNLDLICLVGYAFMASSISRLQRLFALYPALHGFGPITDGAVVCKGGIAIAMMLLSL